ncbi:sigma-70 family RNA polymerase sigma factor [Actinoplanes sp. TRM 88003]|uniref:Sigma-70 family RNA polymerase sigma factor n=1 Tax=Paractinoplanes aksuensis TaxID=2939490 RepID=A0ABT1DUD6_9ACTN|nr:sigma-70 family RNA polymerase sigma factor [Actinoplanes aksuensis]MCO8273565.1 sigma-70 family RNA polymerase sigma factor [Actinoplanes aksuensis]
MEAVAAAHQEHWTRLVATLIRLTGDWTLAEDCAQDALATALERWPRDGVPGNPGGWLMTVARNRALDVLRRAATEDRKLRELALTTDPPAEPDDRLRLIFTCCHPALALESRVALTLRTVAGLPTSDIARAFLVTEPTMTRRLTRAKAKIADARIPYRVPEGDALGERLPGVLAVLYLLFNRGYDGEPLLADEAIRLARLLNTLMPTDPEVSSLLALFLLQHSRRHARRDTNGDLVPLDRQDRDAWDHPAIDEAVQILRRTPVTGPYALQAHIAACHATAATPSDTNWPDIARWYDELARIQPTPVIHLNRAVAHGYAYGPTAGLDQLATTKDIRHSYPMVIAVEADLTARTGDTERAKALFHEAAAASEDGPERRALLARAEELT